MRKMEISRKHVGKNWCGMILGRDLLEQLPLDVKFSDGTMTWQKVTVTVPVKIVDELDDKNIDEIVEQCYETRHLGKATRGTMEILGKF
jgi:hypothetical protein